MSLRAWTVGWGILLLAFGAAGLTAPVGVAQGVRRFPRSRLAAGVLSAAALAWVAGIVRGAELGRFAWVQPWILPAAPVVLVLLNVYMDELLAPRALGGLLALAANPFLFAVRMHASAWSRAPALFAYATVVAGIALLLSPHLFRRSLAPVIEPPARLRAAAAGLAVLGLLLAALGGTVLR